MAKVQTYILCKCGFKSRVVFSRPTENSKATGNVTCAACLSQMKYEITPGEKQEHRIGQPFAPPTVKITTTLIAVSPELQAMILEEQAAKDEAEASKAAPQASENLHQPMT